MTLKNLRIRLCATLAATLAVLSVVGCESDGSEDEAGVETDDGGGETDGDETADTSSGGSVGETEGNPPEDPTEGDPPQDPTDSGAPVDPPDDGPFEDDPQAALGALSGMGYLCYGEDESSFNLFFDSSSITARFDDETTSEGTYDTAGGTLTLSFPELGFVESALDAAVALDALVYFETPSLRCGAYYLDHNAPEGTDAIDCPTIKYIPETSWENNQFHFGDGGYLRRRRWTELPAVPDTLYSVRLGVYRVLGDQMFMVLPFEDKGEQWLTGTITDEGLYIDQLEPEQGACK